MKRILITGAESYIGTSFERWIRNYPGKYFVSTIDMKDGSWEQNSFSEFDVIFHVAGIAHVDVKKANTEEINARYFKVNRDLTIKTAQKAQNEGVKQFIFMSSIIVYGDSSHNNKKIKIEKQTLPMPTSCYGKSKLEAEEELKRIESDEFKIVILRPPMIYGKNSKGNYPKLSKLAQKIPVFPDIDNERSMLHIDNLCEFIRLMIDNNEKGVFFPQNKEYVKTSEMVKLIAQFHGKNVKLTRVFNGPLRILISNIGIANKVFGDLIYEKAMSDYFVDYQIRSLEESIELTEVRVKNE